MSDKLKNVAKDRCLILEPCTVHAFDTATVSIEIPHFPLSPVLALNAVSQLLWPDKDREVWFSLTENHEKAFRFPDFLQLSTDREQLYATFCAESRIQFGCSNNLYRKSGFGLHPLRNCFSDLSKLAFRFLANTTPLPESAAA